ncbi:uncharacterized protein LOC125539449 [Triticum urartu]|uniref:uncharacterized protein LOC125539449 n=1 Tax=Triticum urartu TaxID=4572 RepID=UPI0020448ECE|nr:uncharacterized protein LOC125539449 [Triticum urartu]
MRIRIPIIRTTDSERKRSGLGLKTAVAATASSGPPISILRLGNVRKGAERSAADRRVTGADTATVRYKSERSRCGRRARSGEWCSLLKSPSAGASTSLLISWRADILSFSLLYRCNSMCVFAVDQCVFYESNPSVCSGCFGVSVGTRRGSVMRRSPGRTTKPAMASRTSCRRSPRPPGARKPSCSAPSVR